jgi:chemotaxis protein CheX
MEANIVNPFIESVVNTMRTMCNIDPSRTSLELRKKDQSYSGDISGVIGIIGEISGTVAITYTDKLALAVVSELTGEPQDTVGELLEDGIGEMINIIAGNGKNILASSGYDVAISLPSVVVGKGHTINTPLNMPSIIVGFDTPVAPFWLEICLKRDQ